jgi:hypothetical protein
MEAARIIIAGSRTINDYEVIERWMDHYTRYLRNEKEIMIVSGCAEGVDTLGEVWAQRNGFPVSRFPVNWYPDGKFHRGAAFMRNILMAKNATHLVAFWDGESNGTKHMIEQARKHGLNVRVVEVDV